MTAEARTQIFARLRDSAGGNSANEILRESWTLGHAPYPSMPAEDTHEAFFINVLNNRGSIEHATDRKAAVRAIADYLYSNLRTQRLVAGNDARLAALPWRDAGLLPRFGELDTGEPAALSYAQLGVAELGAAVTWTGKGNPARNNLLPEHHIVLVNSDDIVATSEDAWAKMNDTMKTGDKPRGINFIAGPSSTADIEGRLVYGAHGPRAWHVIVIGAVAEGCLERARAHAQA